MSSTPTGRTKPCSLKVTSARKATAELLPDIAIVPGTPNQPRRAPSRPGSSRTSSYHSPVASGSSWTAPELPEGAAPPPPNRALQPERLLGRSASLRVSTSQNVTRNRLPARTRPSTIFDSLSEPLSIPELVDPRKSKERVDARRSNPPRYSQVVSTATRRAPREKSGWRPSDSTTSDSLYDSSAADARVSKDDVPERWERPFEVNTDEEFLGPVLETVTEPDTPTADKSLSGSALAAFLANERRRDLSLADPFSELGGRGARSSSPRSPRAGSSSRVTSPHIGSPNSPRISTPRLTSPPLLQEPDYVRARAHSSPQITFRSPPEPDRRPEAERRRPKYARHGWRPSQVAAGDHLYEPPALGDDLPARWERPFDLHEEMEIDRPRPKVARPEPEEAPIDRRAINSFLETERRRDLGTSTEWATQLQELGSSIRADPQTAAVLTRVATMGRERGNGRRQHRRGHSRNESWDGSAILGSDRRELSEASRQATIRAVLDPIPGAVPDCTADGREVRRHARRVRQGREEHEDAPPAYMPDRPPVYVEGGMKA